MTLHALFTKGGNPGWIGSAPRERSEVEKADWLAALAEVKARFPKPKRQ